MTTTPRRFQYVQVDVFTSHPLEGNALAVFTDARGLSDAEMQEIHRLSGRKGRIVDWTWSPKWD